MSTDAAYWIAVGAGVTLGFCIAGFVWSVVNRRLARNNAMLRGLCGQMILDKERHLRNLEEILKQVRAIKQQRDPADFWKDFPGRN